MASLVRQYGKLIKTVVLSLLKISFKSTRFAKIAKTLKQLDEPIPDIRISYQTLRKWIQLFHVTLGICAVVFMHAQEEFRQAILNEPVEMTLAYFGFELVNLFLMKTFLHHVDNFPANYISLVIIRCFIFYNNVHLTDIKTFLQLNSGSWSSLSGVTIAVTFLVTIPSIICFTKLNIVKYKSSCLFGTTLSSTLSMVILLSSMLIPPAKNRPQQQLKNNANDSVGFGIDDHFRLCVVWFYLSSFMTYVNSLIICQRIYKLLKKEIGIEEVIHSIPEIFVMLVTFGLTLPYIKIIHPNLDWNEVFPTLQLPDSNNFMGFFGRYVISHMVSLSTFITGIGIHMYDAVRRSFSTCMHKDSFIQSIFNYIDANSFWKQTS